MNYAQRSQKVSFKQTFTSSSTILSAVAGEIRRWWISQFPPKFFKYIRVTSGLPSVLDVENQMDSSALQLYRKANPALALRPRLKFQDDIVGEYLKNPTAGNFYENIGPDSHYNTLVRIPDRLQTISFLFDYWKCEVAVGIRVESEVQMLDIVGMLNARIFPDTYFYINECPVLVEIPVNIIHRSATDLGIDIRSNEGLSAYIEVLQNNTLFPIDIKLNASNGQRMIAFMISCNILCKIDRLPEVEANKRGRVVDDTKIQFSMTAQIPYPKLFKVNTEDPVLDETGNIVEPEEVNEISTIGQSGFSGKGQVLLNYAIRDPMPDVLPGTHARKMYDVSFTVDEDKVTDELALENAIPPEVKAFIDDMLANQRQDILAEVVMFKLYKDDIEVSNQDFHFEFRSKTLILDKPLCNYIYRVGVFMEMRLLHSYEAMLRGVTDLSKIFNHDLLTEASNG